MQCFRNSRTEPEQSIEVSAYRGHLSRSKTIHNSLTSASPSCADYLNNGSLISAWASVPKSQKSIFSTCFTDVSRPIFMRVQPGSQSIHKICVMSSPFTTNQRHPFFFYCADDVVQTRNHCHCLWQVQYFTITPFPFIIMFLITQECCYIKWYESYIWLFKLTPIVELKNKSHGLWNANYK